jgi:dinuclear metal center YbgI/SA1388 family protein
MKTKELVKKLNRFLNIYDYQDYGPNGLQIEGKEEINHIVFAVSATRDSIEYSARLKACALIVHHGLFWKFHGPRPLTGAFGKRVIPIVQNNINLIGYHLPLDANLEVGNAATLARKIGLEDLKPFGEHKGMPTGVLGKLKTPIMPEILEKNLASLLNHSIIRSSPENAAPIKSMGIITGGANSDWVQAKRLGLDSYLTGEISEHDWHEAKESDIHFFAGGHNATEQFGVQALASWIKEQWPEVKVSFFESPNPA